MTRSPGRLTSRGLASLLALLLLCTPVLSLGEQAYEPANHDPWEGLNRKIFAFNEGLDRYLLLPVARSYNAVLPKPVNQGISNFFSNLFEVPNVINDILQWRWAQAGNDAGRFVINSTVGLLGFFDPATDAGLEKNLQDFGITMARWGIDSGPYVVLPVFGPRTVRDSAGLVADVWMHPLVLIDDNATRHAFTITYFIDERADFLAADSLITGDRYVFFRDAWLQQRQFDITGEAPPDDFGDEDFDF